MYIGQITESQSCWYLEQHTHTACVILCDIYIRMQYKYKQIPMYADNNFTLEKHLKLHNSLKFTHHIPLSALHLWGVRGGQGSDFVVGQLFPSRLWLASVLVPQTHTASSFTNKLSFKLAYIFFHFSLCITTPSPITTCMKEHFKIEH